MFDNDHNSWDTEHNQELFNKRLPGYYRTRVNLPCPLKAGSYIISAATMIVNREPIDQIREVLSFEVEEISSLLTFNSCGQRAPGVIAADLVWEIVKDDN